ncbi:ABC-three component system middle component 1 [Cytobacillus praedii]|uniref:ABC-three component system middle component 1 n=1 Tax=Cytobacillus praedii TaxID=1742358 RepID=UPI002E242307|nr:hypothetical protein [Cytobacillus praedii]
MFLNQPEIIEKIRHESGNNFIDSIQCRIKPLNNYNVYMFTVVLNDQEELLENWKDISGDIAIYFQGELTNDIEIWNIYLLFLVQGSVDSEVRYIIEQNKYSSRKLVVENVMRPLDDENINNILEEKLFRVEIDTASKVSSDTESVSAVLKNDYENLYNVVKNSGHEKPAVLFNKYLEVLKNEL